jgi:hypothetical protein
MLVSAAIVALLGCGHLILTLVGPKLWPRDRALKGAMEQVSPVITAQTTMWRAWLGFNISHSMGAMLFGLIYGYLALAHGDLLFESVFLQAAGFVMLGMYVVLAKRYWFITPLLGTTLSLVCYSASLALAWAA